MKRVAVVAVLLALCGCVAPAPTQSQSAAAAQPAVGLGMEQIDGKRAVKLFDAICKKTAPTFADAPRVLVGMNFVQDARTGEYRSKDLDVKVTLRRGLCLMKFTSKEDSVRLGALMVAEGTKDSDAKVKLLALNPETGMSGGPGPKGTYFHFERQDNANGKRVYAAELTSLLGR